MAYDNNNISGRLEQWFAGIEQFSLPTWEQLPQLELYMDQVIQLASDQSSVIWEHCGDIYYKCGETQKALEFWQKAEKVAGEATDENDKRKPEELKLLKKKIKYQKYFVE